MKQSKQYERKILWLGSYQSQEMFEKMKARVFGEASGYTSQKGLITGIDSLLDKDTELDSIACSIALPEYPRYPSVLVKKEKWSRTGYSFDTTVEYLNVKYIKYISRDIALKREIRKWIRNCSGKKENIVIIYEPSVSKLKAAFKIKKTLNARIYVIVPDIPELVALGSNSLIKRAKKYAAKKIRSLFNYVDGFIFYSEHMAQYYNIAKEKWICVEGVFDPMEARECCVKTTNNEPIKLMYCGALDEFRGIPQLLDAFGTLRDKDYELWLTGAGSSEQLIKDRMKKDKRIKYFGFLESRNAVLKLEYQADILIHMRDISSPAAPYCFPSKIFEYLVTGNPVISVDIPGIPREFFQYLIKIDNMSIEAIHRAIHEAVDMSFEARVDLGRKGRCFVLDNKTSLKQAEKILKFIKIPVSVGE